MKFLHEYYIIWALEILVALLLLVSLILGKIVYEIKQRRVRREEKLFKEILFALMTQQKTLQGFEWKKKLISRDVMLRILENYHANFQDKNWEKVETHLTEAYLLPWARANLLRRRWIHRNHVARIFLLHTEEKDRKNIEGLLEDKSYYVRMIAAEALGEIKVAASIPPLLKRMAREAPRARFIYRHVLLKMPLEEAKEILKVYEEAKEDEMLRLCCLDVLSYKYYGNIHATIRKDLSSPNTEIRLFVCRILGNLASPMTVEDLVVLLHDEESRVRESALKALGEIRSNESFSALLPLLQDPEFEVRLAAAKAIFSFGKKGRTILEQQDWDLNPDAYEVARYVLTSY
ncbi:MAG: HEAT repeat domain-containing protein [Chlamydiales bacterium]|nr:HEAT repeat domain-containing protein [Chlamydiales bacterium]